MTHLSPGANFRKALEDNNPLQIVGTINAYCAMLAKEAGHDAIYLSGGGVAMNRLHVRLAIGDCSRARMSCMRTLHPITEVSPR